MKRFLNLVLALSVLVCTANAASAASLGSFIDRYVAPLVNNYSGYDYPYNYGYGYPTSYYSGYNNYPYNYSYPTSYYNGYNYSYPTTTYYDPYAGYGYNPYYTQPTTSVWGGLGNLLLNWF